VLDLGALVADVPEVSILAVDLLLGDGDRDVVLLRVVDRALAVAQLEARVLPRGDDLQVGTERHVRQLEAYLVVALAGGAVADGVGVRLAGDFHLLGGDQRAGDRRAEEIVLFVDRVGAEHREAEIAGEFLAKVHYDHFIGAALVSLVLDALQLVALPEFRSERHELDARVALLEPRKDDGRVESA
jgi:hypothetical protein